MHPNPHLVSTDAPPLPAAGRRRAGYDARFGPLVDLAQACFAFVRHPFPLPAEAAAGRLARQAGVLTPPPRFFGPGQESHPRFAFANVDAAEIEVVVERLRALGGDGVSPR